MSPDNSEDPEYLVKCTDIAMYEAKQDKSNKDAHYKFFEKEMLKRASDD